MGPIKYTFNVLVYNKLADVIYTFKYCQPQAASVYRNNY